MVTPTSAGRIIRSCSMYPACKTKTKTRLKIHIKINRTQVLHTSRVQNEVRHISFIKTALVAYLKHNCNSVRGLGRIWYLKYSIMPIWIKFLIYRVILLHSKFLENLRRQQMLSTKSLDNVKKEWLIVNIRTCVSTDFLKVNRAISTHIMR